MRHKFSNFSFLGILADFVDKVCSGTHEVAEVDPSLAYLGFNGSVSVSDSTDFPVKSEPEAYSYLEMEPSPDLSSSRDRNFDDDFYKDAHNEEEDQDYVGDENNRTRRFLLFLKHIKIFFSNCLLLDSLRYCCKVLLMVFTPKFKIKAAW